MIEVQKETCFGKYYLEGDVECSKCCKAVKCKSSIENRKSEAFYVRGEGGTLAKWLIEEYIIRFGEHHESRIHENDEAVAFTIIKNGKVVLVITYTNDGKNVRIQTAKGKVDFADDTTFHEAAVKMMELLS